MKRPGQQLSPAHFSLSPFSVQHSIPVNLGPSCCGFYIGTRVTLQKPLIKKNSVISAFLLVGMAGAGDEICLALTDWPAKNTSPQPGAPWSTAGSQAPYLPSKSFRRLLSVAFCPSQHVPQTLLFLQRPSLVTAFSLSFCGVESG